MHPVVGSKLGAESLDSLGSGCVIAVVGPGYRLQVGSQITIITVEVNANHLTKAARLNVATDFSNDGIDFAGLVLIRGCLIFLFGCLGYLL